MGKDDKHPGTNGQPHLSAALLTASPFLLMSIFQCFALTHTWLFSMIQKHTSINGHVPQKASKHRGGFTTMLRPHAGGSRNVALSPVDLS